MQPRNSKNSKSLGSLRTQHRTHDGPVYMPTLAEKNHVSLEESTQKYNHTTLPMRILLPFYFNIPKFQDSSLCFTTGSNSGHRSMPKQQKGLKKRLKDLSILAEGMKRSKNIRQESRYYFIQGVVLHNSGMWQKSIEMLQKFFKIVLFLKDHKSIELALNSIGISYMYMNMFKQAREYHQKHLSLSKGQGQSFNEEVNQNHNSMNPHSAEESIDKFIAAVNIGMCKELQGDKEAAHKIYQEIVKTQFEPQQTNVKDSDKQKYLLEVLANSPSKKKKFLFLQKLLERSKESPLLKKQQSNDEQGYFMTEQIPNLQQKSILENSYQSQINSLQFGLNRGREEKENRRFQRLESLNQNSQSARNYSLNRKGKGTGKMNNTIAINQAIVNAEHSLGSYLENMRHSFVGMQEQK